MRLWSLHPKYLDNKGLVACWREALLAQAVLYGETKGYKNHPQLIRFKESYPFVMIERYLQGVYNESVSRGMNFDKELIKKAPHKISNRYHIRVTYKQLKYEFQLLLSKLKERDLDLYIKLEYSIDKDCHPVFRKMRGGIASWEKVRPLSL